MSDAAIRPAAAAARRLLAAAAALTIVAPPAAAQETALCHLDNPAPWVAEQNRPGRTREDPAPACAPNASAVDAPEELPLPMPCGHQMHFRRIDIGVRDVLDHRTVFLGDANAADGSPLNRATSTPHAQPLSGAFLRETGGEGGLVSYYYIGKYEVTAAQWRLFAEGLFDLGVDSADPNSAACLAHAAAVAEAGWTPAYMPPATRVSWFDAIAFSRAYTAWLVTVDQVLIASGGRPLLPWRDGGTGFIRPPSEAEWEYAARGGADSVSLEALSRKAHPVPGPDGALVEATIQDVAILDGLGPDEPVAGVGRRAPNALGLHDVLGNAEEVVLDLFRPTRPDGLKGQFGGAVVRGGSTLTDDAVIGLGHRQEATLFGPEGELRSAVAGVRLAISAPFIVGGADPAQPFRTDLSNAALDEAILAALDRLRGSGGGEADAALARVEGFADRAKRDDLAPAAQALLKEASQIVAATLAAQVQAERDALRERFITAASLLVGIQRTGANIAEFVDRLHRSASRRADYSAENWEALRAAWRDRFAADVTDREAEVEAIFTSYIDLLATIAAATPEDAAVAAKAAAGRVALLNSAAIAEGLSHVSTHLTEIAGRATPTEAQRARWLPQVDATRDGRAEKLAVIRKELEE